MRGRAQEESIYNMAGGGAAAYGVGGGGYGGGAPAAPAAPKIKTYNVSPPAGAPRTRMHEDSSQINSFLNPVRGIRDAQMRAGIKPADHARANVVKIREASRMNALRKQQEEEEAASAGAQGGRLPSRNAAPRRQAMAMAAAAQQQRPSSAAEHDENARDFVSENRAAAVAAARVGKEPRREGEEAQKFLAKRDYGRLPSYLVNRKIEMAAEAEAAAAARAQALVPPGMRMLADQERLETLAILERNKAEVERQIQRLPIIIETPSMIRHRDELERRMREIEDAFRVFSRPKVLVQM